MVLLLAAAVPAAPAGATTQDAERVIVRLKPSSGDTRTVGRALVAENGGTLGPVFTGVLKGFAAKIPEGRLAALRANPNVDAVVPDAPIAGANAELTPGMRRIGADRVAGSKIGTRTAVDTDIAILDTGVNAHSDLTIAGGANCASDTGCTAGFADGHGHGTHVAGTAAAKDDGIGVVGSAPGARVWGVKVLSDTNGGFMSWFIAGLDWVVARGDIEVANASLSGAQTALVDAAIQRATDAGVVVVVAAGNDATDAATRSPASSPQAITVSAFQDNDGAPGGLGGVGDDTFASFSNHGAVVDIAAPGVGISSTSSTGGYVSMSGTSMAAPHVAGAAAVYIANNGVAAGSGRWNTVLQGLRGEWAAGQTSACGFTGGRSAEPVLVMAGCPGGDTVPPTTPALTAAAGNAQVVLSWTQSTDASGIAAYRIYRAVGPSGAFSVLTTITDGTRTHTDAGLTNNTAYRYYVVAIDGATAANTSAASTIRTATPADPAAPPAMPFTATPGDVHVALTWPGVVDGSGIKGYQIWRGVGGAAPTPYKVVKATARYYKDTAVANGTDYSYVVRAQDLALNLSPMPTPVTATPIDNAPPTVPTPTIVVGDGQLTVKWKASKDSSGVGNYGIHYAVGDAPFTKVMIVPGTWSSWTHTGLSNGVPYRYALSAADTAGRTSVQSAPKSATPKDLTGPLAVTAAGSVGDGRADLSWTAATDNAGVKAYQVWRAAGTATFSRVGQAAWPALAFTQTGLDAGTSYRYYVRPVDNLNNVGPPSATLSLRTPTTGMGVPAITYVQGKPGSTTTPVTIRLTVRSDTAAAVGVPAKVTFAIRRSGGALVATKSLTTATTGAGSLRVSLPRGTTYNVTLSSVTAVGRTWDGRTPANSVGVS